MFISRIFTLLLISISYSQLAYSAEYPLSSGDGIEVSVFQHPELSTKTRISESGKINIPLIGTIVLKGKSESEAVKSIENALLSGEFVNNPQVFVVVDYNTRNASIIGRVHSPGQYLITTGETILDFISKAGGIKDDGSSVVTLYRGQDKPITIDIFASNQNSKINRYSSIQKGDVIRVKQAEVFFTSGEVNNPNKYELLDNMTIRQGISISGGMTDKATEKGLRVIRKAPDSSLVNREATLDEIVQPSDIIFVKESLF